MFAGKKNLTDSLHSDYFQIGVETGDINAVQILLRAGAEPGRVNPVLKTSAVHAAAGQARPDMLKALVGNILSFELDMKLLKSYFILNYQNYVIFKNDIFLSI